MRNIPAFDWCELYPERRLGYRRLVEVGQYSHLARLRVLHLLCATPPSMGVRMASALRKCGAHTATRIGSALRLGTGGAARGRMRGLDLNQRAGSPRAEAQDIHGADGDADAAADARGVGVINGFLLQREAHDVNPHQTIPGALRASDAFIVGDNFVAADPELR